MESPDSVDPLQAISESKVRNLVPATLIAVFLMLAGCGQEGISEPEGPGDFSNDRITISNNEDDLDDRVTYFDDQDIPVAGPGKAVKTLAFGLKLVAEVAPPSIDGKVLQATSVDIRGNFAIVSYGMRGAEYLGGVDVFNLTNTRRPRLMSSALFVDSDVNAAAYLDGVLYMAQATGDPAFEYPSVCEVMQLQGHNLILDDNRRFGLLSYAGTSITSTSTSVYTTSGNTGGLAVLDPSSWVQTDFVALHDARWVDVDGGKVVVVQGTPGQLSVYDEATRAAVATYSFTGADIAESKSTVEIVGGKAFVAAGTGGVQVLSVNTGTVVGSVPRPDPASLGLDPSVVVTNAVAVDADLAFISNGEAGVYVAQGSQEFALSNSEDAVDLTLLGQLQFDALQSVNHVAFKKDHVIIASGLGGLKIVQVSR